MIHNANAIAVFFFCIKNEAAFVGLSCIGSFFGRYLLLPLLAVGAYQGSLSNKILCFLI